MQNLRRHSISRFYKCKGLRLSVSATLNLDSGIFPRPPLTLSSMSNATVLHLRFKLIALAYITHPLVEKSNSTHDTLFQTQVSAQPSLRAEVTNKQREPQEPSRATQRRGRVTAAPTSSHVIIPGHPNILKDQPTL